MAVIGLGAPRTNAVGEIWAQALWLPSKAHAASRTPSRRGYHVPCPVLQHFAATDPVHSVNAVQLSVQIEVRLVFPWPTHPP